MQQASLEHIVTEPEAVKARLMQRIREDQSLPALGRAVAEVLRLASAGDEAVGDLARFILSDVALTQKVLRLSNTVACRAASGTPVTTISRAIFLLGFNMIMTSAAAMLLVDRLADRHQAGRVRRELGLALYAGAIARSLSRRTHYRDAEESVVAALFSNLGRILVSAHDHLAYEEIESLQRDQAMPAAQAARQVMDCSFESLGLMVLREWQIPESTIAAVVAPRQSGPKPTKSRQDWLQQAVQFSAETAHIATLPLPAQAIEGKLLLERFGAALGIDEQQWHVLMAQAAGETQALMLQMEPTGGKAAPASGGAMEPGRPMLPELLMAAPDVKKVVATARFPSGKPANARDLLLAGLQDITQMMASGPCKANDLMLAVLETLCNAMGFRFAAVCLLDVPAGQYRARLAIGEQHAARRASLAFPAWPAHDLFHLALENNADLLISEAAEQKIRELLPAWHRTGFADARSFIVLPLVVKGRKVGLFYADRAQPAPEGVPPDETSLIKTLKAQVLSALQAR